MTVLPGDLHRPLLLHLLDEIVRHRLTLVTAGPGGGKTSAVRAWAESRPDILITWLTLRAGDAEAGALAGRICHALARAGLPMACGTGAFPDDPVRTASLAAEIGATLAGNRVVLVLDEVDRLDRESSGVGLLEGLCRHVGEQAHLVLLSRSGSPFPVQRLRGRGEVLDIPGERLAFTRAETGDLVREVLRDGSELADELQEITLGWPVAVRLALTWLSRQPAEHRAGRLRAIAAPAGPLHGYLAEEVLADCAPRERELLAATVALPWFTPDLCGAIGLDLTRAEIGRLAAQRVLVTSCADDPARYTTTTLVRECLEPSASSCAPAARWYDDHGHYAEALATAQSEPELLAAIIERRWESLLAGGHTAALASACAAVPATLRTSAVELAEGQARQILGDWPGALACLRRVDDGSPAVAWRIGMIYYHRGDYRAALKAFDRGGPEGDSADDAMLLAWSASAHWLLGDRGTARHLADLAMDAATASGDDRSVACAHTALAMTAHDEGDRSASEWHSARALTAAEHAGDLLLTVRILANRASHRTEEARYGEALEDLELAVRRAELVGAPVNAAIALHNRAESLLGLGRLDEALADFGAARDILVRIGSDKAGHPMAGLAWVYSERGDAVPARRCYEDALEYAERLADVHLLQPVLAGLARMVAPCDRQRAVQLADRAVAAGDGSGLPGALLAAGWVQWEAGDTVRAAELARSAREAAGARRDHAGTAEALELMAMASTGTADDRAALLAPAAEIWRQVGNALGAARNAFARARLCSGATEEAERDLRRAGMRGDHESCPGLLRAVAALDRRTVRFCLLGGVRLHRDGRIVPAGEWQSKKARDLLTWLVCQRGRRVPREAAVEVLWPGEDPARCGNRLSVALSTVRAVLDPRHLFPPEEFLRADRYSIRLTGLHIDVEGFLTAAAEALEKGGEDLLALAEARYTGDVGEDAPYESWLEPLREEARAAHLALLRALAGLARDTGDHDRAIRYLLRLLERDPYDEPAHLDLVRTLSTARRHGEARRRHRLYVEAMAELGIEGEPFLAVRPPPPVPGRGPR